MVGVRPGDGPGDGQGDGAYERAVGAVAAGLRGAGPAEAPGRLCAVAVDLLPVDGASVSLRGDSMPLRLAASGDVAARLAEPPSVTAPATTCCAPAPPSSPAT
ncbi:hypothetical protein RKD47_003088 [Streptomyces albogriseolus]